MEFNGRQLEFLAVGQARRAYSDRNGTCVKVPLTFRENAGKMQNRAEAACLKKMAELGLTVAPMFKSISKDGRVLAVEECHSAVGSAEFFDYTLNWLHAAGVYFFNAYGCQTPIHRIAWALATLDLNRDNVDLRIWQHSTRRFAETTTDKNLADTARILSRAIDLALSSNKDPLAQIVKFWNTDRKSIVLQELWHDKQWGIRKPTGEIVVLDLGYSVPVQKSKHYGNSRVGVCSKAVSTGVLGYFNGEPIDHILSPNGKAIVSSFKTSCGSEYILAEDGMSRRVKKASLPDDGLHSWMDKLVFVGTEDRDILRSKICSATIAQRAQRIVDNGDTLDLYIVSDLGLWKKAHTCHIDHAPSIGKHVCEFLFDDNCVVKSFHFGHAVDCVLS